MKIKNTLIELSRLILAILYPVIYIQFMQFLISLTFHDGIYNKQIPYTLLSAIFATTTIISVGYFLNKHKIISLSILSSLFVFIYLYIIRAKMDFDVIMTIMLKDKATFITMGTVTLLPIISAIILTKTRITSRSRATAQ